MMCVLRALRSTRCCFAWRCNRIDFLILGLLVLGTPLALGARDDFEHPNSFIGNAGWSGGLELWVELADIPVARGISLPLRLRFSSDAIREHPLLGGHWWCPLLECDGKGTADYIEFTTSGGERSFLLKSNGWRSKDGKASGREVDGIVEIESGPWRYRYKNGRIEQANGPDGVGLRWIYQEGEIVAIEREAGDEQLLQVSRGAGTVTISGAFGEFHFRRETSGSATEWFLKFPDGRTQVIEIAPESEDVTQMTIITRWNGATSGNLVPQMRFRWKTSTGELLSDDDFTYEIRRTDTGEDILHRVDRKGRTEWYTFDTARGLATYKRQDGSRVQSWYHVEPGPRYMKCFRMDTLSKDQALVSSRLLTYDAQGNVEKEWIEQGPAALEKGGRFIGTEEAEQLHSQSGILFIDARKLGEYKHAHIPAAVHLGRSSFETDYPAMENRLKAADTLVVYCTSRQCEDSSIVATRLSQLGYESVLVFEGGWAEWWKRHR